MAIVVGVRFRSGQKIYYFDPLDIDFLEDDGVILETARGMEYGTVAFRNREVPDKEIVSPLKPVLRKATEKDTAQNAKNLTDRSRIMDITSEKAASRRLPMKVADAEYTFDRSKLIIYFTADTRIDFRELVKDLAATFHVRIELRQIYERDDIKLRGALATCGRPCCCITHLNDYDKVSIKMAKVQGLSLNPGKISGNCGKLMCCLRYEYPYYQEVSKKMPKYNASVKTPQGEGQVSGVDMLKQEVKVRVIGGDGSVSYHTCSVDDIQPCGKNCPNAKRKEEDEEES